MNCEVTRKTHTLRVIAQLFGILTVLISLATLAQTVGAGQVSVKPSVAAAKSNWGAPLQSKELPVLPGGRTTAGTQVSPTVAYSSGGLFPTSIALGDFNGDGKPDVVVANWCAAKGSCGNGGVNVLLNNGDGTLTLGKTNLAGAKETSAIATGDFNSDGKLDVVVASKCSMMTSCGHSAITVLMGNGDGTLQPAVKYVLLESDARALAVSDFNGDGKLDLAVAGDIAEVLLGNGDGTFRPSIQVAAGGTPSSVVAGDFNGDGELDLAVAHAFEGFVTILLGNGDGTFQPAVNYARGTEALGIGVGGFNGDSKLDLAVSEAESFNLAVLLGDGNGTFGTPTEYPTGAFDSTSVGVGDFNEDGKLDLAVTNTCQLSSPVCSSHGTVAVLLGGGDGTFKVPLNYDSGGFDKGVRQTRLFLRTEHVVAGDLDGDGHSDLVVSNRCADSTCNNGSIIVFRGNGDGTFDGQVVSNHYGTRTALTSNPNPSMFGQAVTLTATVTSFGPNIPTGKVKFLDGTLAIGSAILSGGGAKLTKSNLAVGTHPITAQYVGDAASAKSTSSVVNQVVQ